MVVSFPARLGRIIFRSFESSAPALAQGRWEKLGFTQVRHKRKLCRKVQHEEFTRRICVNLFSLSLFAVTILGLLLPYAAPSEDAPVPAQISAAHKDFVSNGG